MCGCLSCSPYWGPGLQPGVPLVHRLALNPLSHNSQGPRFYLWQLTQVFESPVEAREAHLSIGLSAGTPRLPHPQYEASRHMVQ